MKAVTHVGREEALLKAGVLQNAISSSANRRGDKKGPRHILIVDDYPTNLKLLRSQLEAEGHTVLDAPDGVAALAVLQHQPVDAVISDILMPKMDGYRLCHEVRKQEQFKELPIIIYTATYTSPDDEKLALDMGADKYLRKPAAVEAIVAALREVSKLPSRRHQAPGVAVPEVELMKEYSERLVSKLEERNRELSAALAHLQASEERLLPLKQSIEGMLEGIQIIDRQWRYVYVNAAAARQGRYSSAELVGRTMMECCPGIADTPLFGAMLAVTETQSSRQMQNEVAFADGTKAWFDLSIEPDPNGILIRSMDITKHKQAEDALIKAGALQTAIFNSAHFSSIATDAKGVIQIFNIGAERMLGYTAAEVVNQITPADLHDPQEVIARAAALSIECATPIAPGFEALVFKASRGIEDISELTNVRKDGSRFPAVVSVTALRDAQNAIIGYLLIGSDNTARRQVEEERKRAEEARRASDARYHTLFECAPDGIVIADLHGRYLDANGSICRMLGYSREELIQRHSADIVTEAEIPQIAPALSGINAGSPCHREWQLRRKDGSVFDAEVIATAMPDGNVLTMIRDITDRRHAEKQRADALRELNDVRAAIDEHAIVAITDARGKIAHVNDKFCGISKYSREELLGQDHRIINSGFHTREFMRSLWQTISAGQVWKGEIKNQAKDGACYWVDATIVPYLGADGRPVQYISIRTDITERKRFEQALQETNVNLESAKIVAEKANLAKSDFLSSMSHELRTPLNAILGFAQLMESASPAPTAAQTKNLAQILQAGWYLLKLINEVLDLAGIESGKVSLSKEAVSLAELMSECQDMMEPQAQQRGIRMTFSHFDHPVFVSADRTRLKQVVINLVSNAIKYNQEQGTVVVDCTVSALPSVDSCLRPTSARQVSAAGAERIRISVRDTGAGLPPEKLAQLFSPFNRLGQEAGTVAGTGIGLVVSKRLAELMGGVIGVESTVGVGSVFWCELDSAEAPQVAGRSGDTEALRRLEAPSDAPRRTLLYVEDNPANMQLVEEVVARFPNLGLVTAVNGTLGLERARATEPQVILMDINLPGISGIQALKILREDPATAHIPVVALSANAMPRDIEKGLEAGFFRYLTKPIKIKELMVTLNAALELAEKPLVKPT